MTANKMTGTERGRGQDAQRHRRSRNAARLACIACLAGGLLALAPYLASEVAYTDLVAEVAVVRDDEQTGADTTIDWAALQAINGNVVAWLTVDGTSIDHPVTQPTDDMDPDYYLSHDLWNASSSTGCIYLDQRADADGGHLLVYGHHLGWTTLMFSELFQTYRQEEFDGIGTAVWNTPCEGATAFTPVFAMSVDMGYQDIQTFSFESSAELRAWLLALGEESTAQAEGWETLCTDADRALTLVTCSSTLGGQRERTLVVFVAA